MTRRTERAACSEYAELSRRGFLRTAAAGAVATTAMPRVAFSAARGTGGGAQRDVLINVFLRGGMDGLSAVVPYGDPDYASSRGPLAIPGPSSGNGSVDLDGTFCLSPPAAPLHTPSPNSRAYCTGTDAELQELVKYSLRKLGRGWQSPEQEALLRYSFPPSND